MQRILWLLLLFSQGAFSQSADYILLKKKNRVVQTFFKGSHIEFVTTRGAYRDAQIRDIRNDSIFLQEYLIKRVPTTLGFFIIDTAGSFSYKYHYKEIGSFGKTNKKFNVLNSGSSLFSGGLLITLASGVSYIANKKKFSPGLAAAGVGLGGLGYLTVKAAGKPIVPGKRKYKLEYINISAK